MNTWVRFGFNLEKSFNNAPRYELADKKEVFGDKQKDYGSNSGFGGSFRRNHGRRLAGTGNSCRQYLGKQHHSNGYIARHKQHNYP